MKHIVRNIHGDRHQECVRQACEETQKLKKALIK
jgi:hypothetical protein